MGLVGGVRVCIAEDRGGGGSDTIGQLWSVRLLPLANPSAGERCVWSGLAAKNTLK